MADFKCKLCGKKFSNDNEDRLIEKVHTHYHTDHGKHISKRKIARIID